MKCEADLYVGTAARTLLGIISDPVLGETVLNQLLNVPASVFLHHQFLLGFTSRQVLITKPLCIL